MDKSIAVEFLGGIIEHVDTQSSPFYGSVEPFVLERRLYQFSPSL